MDDDLNRLWQLAGNDGTPDDWNSHFDAVGLILQIPPKRDDYACTPLNSITFARTGVDGVHFGLLLVHPGPLGEQPVVMTVPPADENRIVGATLRDFLALGCRTGYGSLDGLVHRPDDLLEELEIREHDPDMDDEDRDLLRALEAGFELVPWDFPRRRLAELQGRFEGQIKPGGEVGVNPVGAEGLPEEADTDVAQLRGWLIDSAVATGYCWEHHTNLQARFAEDTRRHLAALKLADSNLAEWLHRHARDNESVWARYTCAACLLHVSPDLGKPVLRAIAETGEGIVSLMAETELGSFEQMEMESGKPENGRLH